MAGSLSIKKWGNGNGIRIPNELMKLLGIHTNDKLHYEVVGNQIIIKKATEPLNLDMLFADYNGEKFTSELISLEATGKELW